MAPEALAYFNEASDYIQAHSVKRNQIDWQALRQQVDTLAAEAQIPAETYPAIRATLERGAKRLSFHLPLPL